MILNIIKNSWSVIEGILMFVIKVLKLILNYIKDIWFIVGIDIV